MTAQIHRHRIVLLRCFSPQMGPQGGLLSPGGSRVAEKGAFFGIVMLVAGGLSSDAFYWLRMLGGSVLAAFMIMLHNMGQEAGLFGVAKVSFTHK